MTEDDRLAEAKAQYERAVFGGYEDAVGIGERALDGLEADLALARGRLLHAKWLAEREDEPRELTELERAAHLYRELGDERGEAEALFWIGTYHQVCRRDNESALPPLRRSYELAVKVGDRLTQSYTVRHLGFVDQLTGRLDEARAWFDESLRLRRELDFRPGVAAALLALAQLDLERGERELALQEFDEAAEVAGDSGAHRISSYIEEARSEI
ncbi:MAG TPA: tetratricopeptide repeat protein [Candidatus Limnocylindrales bacterium]|nr:tetratricopeptide repeat protein [Candidatus Limnocylindrales bacterium]